MDTSTNLLLKSTTTRILKWCPAGSCSCAPGRGKWWRMTILCVCALAAPGLLSFSFMSMCTDTHTHTEESRTALAIKWNDTQGSILFSRERYEMSTRERERGYSLEIRTDGLKRKRENIEGGWCGGIATSILFIIPKWSVYIPFLENPVIRIWSREREKKKGCHHTLLFVFPKDISPAEVDMELAPISQVFFFLFFLYTWPDRPDAFMTPRHNIDPQLYLRPNKNKERICVCVWVVYLQLRGHLHRLLLVFYIVRV